MMEDDLFKDIDFDMLKTLPLATSMQPRYDACNKLMYDLAQDAYNNRQSMQRSLEKTSENTSQANDKLQ